VIVFSQTSTTQSTVSDVIGVQVSKMLFSAWLLLTQPTQPQHLSDEIQHAPVLSSCNSNRLLKTNIDGVSVTHYCVSGKLTTDLAKVGSGYLKTIKIQVKATHQNKKSKATTKLPKPIPMPKSELGSNATQLLIPQIPQVVYTDSIDDTYPSLHYLTVEGKTTRQYFLVAPDSYDPTTPLPILIGLHGINGSPASFRDQFLFGALASEYKYVGIFPLGWGDEVNSNPTWNAGSCCLSAMVANINDVEFIQAIIQEVNKNYFVDESRIWAVGFSAGGMMAYKLACDLASVVTAIGVVSGTLMQDPCSPVAPVSIIHLHGDLDDAIPLLGGGQYNAPPVRGGVLTSAGMFGCTPSQDDPIEMNAIESSSWSCSYGTEVRLDIFKGIGHEFLRLWPYELVDFLMLHPRIK
jgi:polyhydroxybutyrate depolymerase